MKENKKQQKNEKKKMISLEFLRKKSARFAHKNERTYGARPSGRRASRLVLRSS